MNIYPNSYQEAINTAEKNNWWIAMCIEFQNAERKGVWEIVSRHNIPKERKIIANRWVFTRKDDGRFGARCVAKGFSQIPGKDFQENYAPVIHDTTFHLIIAMSILYKLDSCQFDVETAFLYGELEENIYMELPVGCERYLIDKANRMGSKKIKIDIKTSCLL
jgi:Reverse transcriptase (RNA-dependent DNA polymerase)